MKGITAAIASALPAGAPWLFGAATEPGLWSDEIAETSVTANEDQADEAAASADLADLLKRHDDVLAAEQQSFNHRLTNIMNTRRDLPANDRRRLNALLAELLEQRDEVAPEAEPQAEEVPAKVIVSFDQAVDGIVKSLNEDFATSTTDSQTVGRHGANDQ